MKCFKLFIGNTPSVTIVCPECGHARSVETSKIPGNVNSFRARCMCGEVFTVAAERRRCYRKETRLEGKLFGSTNSQHALADIHVSDLSVKGMKFTCKWNRGQRVEVAVGDEFLVRVLLGSDEDVRIEARVIVRNVRSENIGAEFIAIDEHSRKILGFYMMP